MTSKHLNALIIIKINDKLKYSSIFLNTDYNST